MANDFVSVIQPGAPRKPEGEGSGRSYPVLPVRDTVLFPHAVLPLTVGRESSIQLIQSLGEDKTILVVAQKDARQDSPEGGDLHPVGTRPTRACSCLRRAWSEFGLARSRRRNRF
jgi:ATP-dependent Lon protease